MVLLSAHHGESFLICLVPNRVKSSVVAHVSYSSIMSHGGDLLDLSGAGVVRDRREIERGAREHAMAVIRDYNAQPRIGTYERLFFFV